MMMIMKIIIFNHLTNNLYVTVFIIVMFIESKNKVKLIKLNDFMILLNEDDFLLSWVIIKEINLFNIWIKIKLFYFIATFYLLFPIVRWAYDALNPPRRRSPWHVDPSYAPRSIRHIGRIPTRRSRARYFLWHES